MAAEGRVHGKLLLPKALSKTFQQAAEAAMIWRVKKAETAGLDASTTSPNATSPPAPLTLAVSFGGTLSFGKRWVPRHSVAPCTLPAAPNHSPARNPPSACAPSRDAAAAALEDRQTQGNQWEPKRARATAGSARRTTPSPAAPPADANLATSTIVPNPSVTVIDEATLAVVLEEMAGEEAVEVLLANTGVSFVQHSQLPSRPDALSLLSSSLPPTSSTPIDELFEMC